jgi:hypothetical protein
MKDSEIDSHLWQAMLKATSQRSPSVIKEKKIPDERKQTKAEKSAAAAGKVFTTKQKRTHHFSDDLDNPDNAQPKPKKKSLTNPDADLDQAILGENTQPSQQPEPASLDVSVVDETAVQRTPEDSGAEAPDPLRNDPAEQSLPDPEDPEDDDSEDTTDTKSSSVSNSREWNTFWPLATRSILWT